MNLDESYIYCSSSLVELHNHMVTSGIDPQSTAIEARVRQLGNACSHVQIWLTGVASRISSDILWDSLILTEGAPEDLEALLSYLLKSGAVVSEVAATQDVWTAPPKDIPMFRYHPQRFRSTSDLAKKAGQALASSVPGTAFNQTLFEQLAAALTQASQARVSEQPMRLRLNGDPRAGTGHLQAALFYGDFVRNGRQIFDFPPGLVESFRKSDVTAVPLSAIKLPYASFYLYFGPQDNVESAPGWVPDGAYVSRVGGPDKDFEVIQFCLTSAPVSQAVYEATADIAEPYYIQAVPRELMELGIGEATEKVFEDKLAALMKQTSSLEAAERQQMADQAVSEMGLNMDVEDVAARNAAYELQRAPAKYLVWKDILRLIINAIAYLTSYQDDIETAWPAKTPENFLAQLKSGSPKQKLRARSKLSALGYTAIHLCGKHFTEMLEEQGDSMGLRENSKKPVWVRGTWVWQAHGPRHSLRRLQWRMPHLRNKTEQIGEEDVGHLYLVS